MRPRSKTTNPSRLSQAVVKLRRALGLTQHRLAALLGVSPPAIGRYETDRSPSGAVLTNLRKLAREQCLKHPDDDDLRDLDDVFYSAMVDEFPVYRHALTMGLQAIAGELLADIIRLSRASDSRETRTTLEVMTDRVSEVQRFAEILNPLNSRLPDSPSAEDVQEILEPMFIRGGLRYTGSAAVNAVMRHRERIKPK
jgi:transcriptional regulator with XRE-family HTH domain